MAYEKKNDNCETYESCNGVCEGCPNAPLEGKTDFRIEANEFSKIKKIYAVMSGKGGVGKSMVTSLLAVQLSKKGYKVGILDADVTGPSIPKSFGIKEKARGSQFGILPVQTKTGIKLMSINVLLEDETDPVIWRGPVIASSIQQFYQDVIWGDIDVMLVDMPPGTGDVPLTVFQSLPVDGIITVTSPQDLVSLIVTKAMKMASMMHKELIGVVENMSYFKCPKCGENHNIFGDSHLESILDKNNIKTYAKLPIDPDLSALQDKGLIEDADASLLDSIVSKIEESLK